MLRVAATSFAAFLVLAGFGEAQVLIPGGGTSVPGDILRGQGVASYGLGVEAYGVGMFNLLSAQAESIHVDTSIRWHQYWADVIAFENQKNSEHRAFIHAKRQRFFEEIRKRIAENPEERDVMIGDALNVAMTKLRSPGVDSSSLSSSNVPIPADAIRRIHFRIDRQGVGFSMHRLSPKGKARWPVFLREPVLDPQRRSYEWAFDKALEEQIERRTSNKAIQDVESALANLESAFENHARQTGLPTTDTRYKEAKKLLREMKASYELLKHHKAESVIAEIETYAGTGVADLVTFMKKHNLRFGPADDDSPEERKLYAELYEVMTKQKQFATDLGKAIEP